MSLFTFFTTACLNFAPLCHNSQCFNTPQISVSLGFVCLFPNKLGDILFWDVTLNQQCRYYRTWKRKMKITTAALLFIISYSDLHNNESQSGIFGSWSSDLKEVMEQRRTPEGASGAVNDLSGRNPLSFACICFPWIRFVVVCSKLSPNFPSLNRLGWPTGLIGWFERHFDFLIISAHLFTNQLHHHLVLRNNFYVCQWHCKICMY